MVHTKREKLPAFQFYPADWRKDVALGAVSPAARGLWFEMLCVMHECTPYGYLAMHGRRMPDEIAAAQCRVRLDLYRRWVRELEEMGVLSRVGLGGSSPVDKGGASQLIGGVMVGGIEVEHGTIFSRRMVRDHELRAMKREAGKQGGNPALKPHSGLILLNHQDNHPGNSDPPSSVAVAVAVSASASDSEPSPTPPAAGEGDGERPAAQKRINGHGGKRMPPNLTPPAKWIAWAVDVQGCDRVKATKAFIDFRDYWADQPGDRGLRVSWFPTWKGRVRDLKKRGEL